jgi:hypothetical protein
MAHISRILVIAIVSMLVAAPVSGCGKKEDGISKAEKTEKDRPSIAETKAIAEDGLIYGPVYLVMRFYWPKTESPSTCLLAKARCSHQR